MIIRVTNSSFKAGLRNGDLLIDLNGSSVRANFSVFRVFENVTVGSSYKLTVLRSGTPYQLQLTSQPFSFAFWFGVIIAVIIVPLEYLFFSLLLVLFSNAEKRALMLAAALALTTPDVPLFSLVHAPAWSQIIMIAGRPISYLCFPLYLHFSTIFPAQSPIFLRFSPMVRRIIIYSPFLILGFFPALIIQYLTAYEPSIAFIVRESTLGYIGTYAVVLFYVGAIFTTLIITRRREHSDTARKADIVLKGFVFSFSILLARFIFLFCLRYSPLDVQTQIPSWLLEWIVVLAFGTLLLFPLYLVYAVYRHRLISLNEAAKRAREYTVIYAFLVLIYVTILVIINYIAIVLIRTYTNINLVLGVAVVSTFLVLLCWKVMVQMHRRLVMPRVYNWLRVSPHELNHSLSHLFREMKAIASAMSVRSPIDVHSAYYL